MGSTQRDSLDWIGMGYSRIQVVGHGGEIGQGGSFAGRVVEEKK